MWYWLYRRRFAILLGTLFAFIVVAPLAEEKFAGVSVPHLMAAPIYLAAIGATLGTRKHLGLALGLAAVALACAFAPWAVLRQLGAAIDIALLVYTATGILRYVVTVPRVTHSVLLAAVGAYLLVGLMFARVFYLYHLVLGDPIIMDLGQAAVTMPDYVYFSFTTLTTVGYGDVRPAAPLARVTAVVEAVTGQVFMVVLIGRLVGLSISHAEKES
jgi:voltage-gated potassium channel Kch